MEFIKRIKQSQINKKRREAELMAKEAINTTYDNGCMWLVVHDIPVLRIGTESDVDNGTIHIHNLPAFIDKLRKEYINRLNNN